MIRRPARLVFAVALAVALGTGALLLRAEWTCSPKTGEWAHTDAADVDGDISDNQFQHGLTAFQAGRYAEAQRIIEGWLRFYRYTRDCQQGLFLLGEIHRAEGDYDAAWASYEDLLNRYAATDLRDRVLSLETEMAQAYLNGKKRKILRSLWVTARQEGETMLEKIYQRDPKGARGKAALLVLADYHFARSRFAESEDEYQKLATVFARDADAAQFKLLAAQSALGRFRGAKTDARALGDAEQRFKYLQEEHPDLAKRENVAEVLQVIDERRAEKDFETAEFYKKTRKTRAAIFYYRAICRDYAGTLWASRAKERLVSLGAEDRVDPKTAPTVAQVGVGLGPMATATPTPLATIASAEPTDESRPPRVLRAGLAPVARNMGLEWEGYVIDVGDPMDENSPPLPPAVAAWQVGDLADPHRGGATSQPGSPNER